MSKLLLNGLSQRRAGLSVDRLTIEIESALGERSQCMSELDCTWKGRSRSGQFAYQANPQCLIGIHGAPRHRDLECPAFTDEAGQTDGPAIHKGHPPSPVEGAKYRIVGGNAEIAPQSKFKASGHRIAFNGGDHRLAKSHARWSHRSIGALVPALSAFTACHLAQVGAGTKRAAFAGKDGNTKNGI